MGQIFNLRDFPAYQELMRSNPRALDQPGLGAARPAAILNFVNGRRDLAGIRLGVVAATGGDVSLRRIADYLGALEPPSYPIAPPNEGSPPP